MPRVVVAVTAVTMFATILKLPTVAPPIVAAAVTSAVMQITGIVMTVLHAPAWVRTGAVLTA